MKSFRCLFIVSGLALIVIVNSSLYAFVKEAHGIEVITSDYGIRGQRQVVPTMGLNSQSFVNKGIYPIKLSVTNKSSHVVTISPDSLPFAQLNSEQVLKKVGGLSTRHILAILVGFLGAGASLINLENARRLIHTGDRFANALAGLVWAGISSSLFYYAWSDSLHMKTILNDLLDDICIQQRIAIYPGATLEKFIFINQETYNQINTVTLILEKNTESIAFQMPLD